MEGTGNIRLPWQVKKIIGVLQENGYEAYAVGGCVRDSLLGQTPNDWDITTNAAPKQVKRLFRRTVDTGIAHGTVTVLLDRQCFEVTTYRIDGKYEDGRHPKEVTFTLSLTEDLKRRDFTINAMAYNEQDGLIDCFGGMQDLKDGLIRCVGCAAERFTEDALRILRCLRFSAQLGFAIEEATREAASRLAPKLAQISAERIQAELTKLLVSLHPERIQEAYDMRLMREFLPEIAVDAPLVHGVCAVSRDGADEKRLRYMRYAMLMRRLTPKQTEGCLRRLKFDNETIRTVTGLVTFLPMEVEAAETDVRRAICRTGEALFVMLPTLWRACCAADAQMPDCEKTCGMPAEQIDQIEALHKEIQARGDCVSMQTLAVSGKDLIAVGMKPGKEMGALLERLLDHVLAAPQDNQKEILLQLAEKKNGNGDTK